MRKNSNASDSWAVLQGMSWDADGMLVPDRTRKPRNGRRPQASKTARRSAAAL